MDDLFPNFPIDFGRYHILRQLGKGGMGTVYLAEDTKLRNRKTAIKIPTATLDAENAKRFQREAEASGILKHPNICTVYDVGTIDGRQYLALDFIDGQPLSHLVGTGKLWQQDAAIALTTKLAEALQYAHENGVIHRDIKPSNIMLTENREPILMDFGLAKLSGNSTLTQVGCVFGTPHYMPIEQARGQIQNIGPHSDVYSLAVVLFQMLSGELPFVGSPLNVITQLLGDDTPPLRQVLPDIDPLLEAVCAKAMAKEWTLRYPSMREFAHALAGCRPLQSASNFYPESQPNHSPSTPAIDDSTPIPLVRLKPAHEWTRRRYWALAGLLIIAVGAAIWGFQREGSPKANESLPGSSAEPPNPTDLAPGEKFVEFEYVLENAVKKGRCRVLSLDIGSGESMEFVRIAKGRFVMGSPSAEEKRNTNEEHKEVKIDANFYLARYETTQAQYRAIAGESPSLFKGDRLPVERVSWDDAKRFCDALSQKLGRTISLPTEEQWEYSCRAGTTTTFHFGSELNGERANCDGRYPYGTEQKARYLEKTTEVGAYPANRWGLHDMHGNVWEWCENQVGTARLLRGGGWNDHAQNARSAQRYWGPHNDRTENLGFRCATPAP